VTKIKGIKRQKENDGKAWKSDEEENRVWKRDEETEKVNVGRKTRGRFCSISSWHKRRMKWGNN
jgi:hypothetical protein